MYIIYLNYLLYCFVLISLEIDEKGILHSSDKRFPRKLDFGVDKQNNTLQEDY